MKEGEGNGTPLQYSCLENPMDGGAWWAAVHWVAKSWTRLSDFTFTFHFHTLEKEMATHSSVLVWRIPGMGQPGRRLSMGLHRVHIANTQQPHGVSSYCIRKRSSRTFHHHREFCWTVLAKILLSESMVKMYWAPFSFHSYFLPSHIQLIKFAPKTLLKNLDDNHVKIILKFDVCSYLC